jgi:hypothetical protein
MTTFAELFPEAVRNDHHQHEGREVQRSTDTDYKACARCGLMTNWLSIRGFYVCSPVCFDWAHEEEEAVR